MDIVRQLKRETLSNWQIEIKTKDIFNNWTADFRICRTLGI